MEALIAAAVGYLVKAAKENKELTNFSNDLLGATVDWIRPLFLKDDGKTEKDQLTDFKAKPDSKANQAAIGAKIEEKAAAEPNWANELHKRVAQLQSEGVPPAPTQIIQNNIYGDNFGGDQVQGDKFGN